MPKSKQDKGVGAQDGHGLLPSEPRLHPHVLATLNSINPEVQQLSALAFFFYL